MTCHPRVRHLHVVAGCRPASPIGAELLRRYVDAVDYLAGSAWVYQREVELLRAICGMVEDTPFCELSLATLEAAAHAPQPTARRTSTRREAARRLRRLLQSTGELPNAETIRYERFIHLLLSSAPARGRRTLERWEVRRRDRLAAFERYHEIRHLTRLEQVIEDTGATDDAVIVHHWLRRTVRRIVACRCPPVTRSQTPGRCIACGATTATHGSRPSPGPGKQRRLERLAHRYLAFRRLPDPTREIT